MSDNSIWKATWDRCIEHQITSAAFASDAQHLVTVGAMSAAINAQRHAKEYHDAATDRLERLIGVS